jgi:hypothetical protein
MQSKLMLAALALLMMSGAALAELGEQPNFEGTTAATRGLLVGPEPQTDGLVKLYLSYRLYAYAKGCNDVRQGYAVVYVNDVQIERARLRIQAIEKDTLPSVVVDPDNLARAGKAVATLGVKLERTMIVQDDGALDSTALFNAAVNSLGGMRLDASLCNVNLRRLLLIPSTGGIGVVKKDF